jgi:hypothetical protein
MAAKRYLKIGVPVANKGMYFGDVGGTVQVFVDSEALAHWLGARALSNKSGKARACGGGVMVEVVTRNPKKD